jgi:hypothetical protein
MSQINKEEAARSIFGIGRNDGCEYLFLTTPQLKAIADTLAVTDELDAVYDAQGSAQQYAAIFNTVRKIHEEAQAAFPKKDIRALLLGSIVKCYLDVGTLILGTELKQYQDDYSATVAAARMRKLFLRKIISGDLDDEGQGFLNYLLGK